MEKNEYFIAVYFQEQYSKSRNGVVGSLLNLPDMIVELILKI